MKDKGLSPLIGIVLVIAFTLAVAGIISAWITTFAQEETDQLSDDGSQQIDCTNSRLFFNSDDVTINQSGNNEIKVAITNEGDVNQTDFEMSWTEDDGDLTTNTSAANSGSTLRPGAQLQLTANNLENNTPITNVRVATGEDDDCSGTAFDVDL